MSQCTKCKINVLDDAYMCPMCRRVLDREDSGESIEESKSVMYPDISIRIRRSLLAIKLCIFISVVAEAVCILVNYLTYGIKPFKWSLLTGLGLIFGCISLIISVRRTRSHRRKIVFELLVWLLLLAGVDYSIGFRGWSITFGYPISIMAVLIGIAILMMAQSHNWHSYIYPLMWISVFAVGSLLLAILITQVSFILLNIISVLVSLSFLAGIIIVGDRKAENEIKRRFYV